MRLWYRRPLVMALTILSGITPGLAAHSAEEAEKQRPATVARPSWGKVIGWVMDARTRQPLPNARVAVEIDGAFPESGKGTDLTEKDGRYVARAPLGKISSKFDWGRVLTMNPISLVLSPKSATKQTRIMDVTQVNVRVEAEGYKPFVGRVRSTLLNPSSFSVTLDDVWLSPADAPLASFTPDRLRLEVVEGLKVEPAIAAPGEKVKITLATRLPVDRGFKYRAFATSSMIRVVDSQVELKREKGDPETADGENVTRLVFSREVTLPKRSVDRWTEISFFLIRDGATVLRQRETKVLLQIVETPEERSAAEKVAEGFAQARVADRDGALRQYELARKEKPDYALAHRLYGELSLQLNRPQAAADAFGQLVRLDPRDYDVGRSRYAMALMEAGKPDQALAELAEAEKVLGKQRIPPMVYLTRARVYAARGNFEEADKWLAKAGSTLQISDETLSEINLRRMFAAVKSSPENPDVRLSYARVLEGARRREEALVQVRKAAALDPAQPWAFLELGDLLWQLGQREEAVANFRHAVKLAPTNAEAMLALADAEKELGRYDQARELYAKVVEAQPLNLRARHHHALMLYATGDLEAAREELLRVVREAQAKGEVVDNGIPLPGPGILGSGIYFGPKRRLVAGFSMPEASADLAIAEALEDLEKHPRNGLLWQNIGNALLDLDLPALAVPALRRSREYDPSLLETRFLLAVAYRRTGDLMPAQEELKAVIAANPLHPRARLELAQLYTDDGELDKAQAEILAHSKNYPYERPARATRSLGG